MSEGAAAPGLMPSQAIRSTSGNGNDNRVKSSSNSEAKGKATGSASTTTTNNNNNTTSNNNGNLRPQRGKNRNANANRKQKNSEGKAEGGAKKAGESKPKATAAAAATADNNAASEEPANKPNNARRRNRKKSNKNSKENNNNQETADKTDENPKQNNGNNNNNKQQQQGKNENKNRRNNRARNNKKKYPWRKHIPVGSVDPITLDALVSLPYPPFALRASPPYLPVPEWPPKDDEPSSSSTEEAKLSPEEAARERERQLLQEQWGKVVLPTSVNQEESEEKPKEEAAVVANPKHLNLFDGRALAYYMVSQLQFIDPLNRRDLMRDELCHLDRYLVRHGLDDLNVVEAYDTKGVSLSTAGSASTTAAGRAEILQQEARVLLNALFGHSPTVGLPQRSNNTSRSNNNSLQNQYSNYQATQQQGQRYSGGERHDNSGYPMFGTNEDEGIYMDETGGMLVIDDDLNPSLRGSQDFRPNQFGSNSHNMGRHGHQANLREQHFPALSSTNRNASTTAPTPSDYSRLSSSSAAFYPALEAAAAAPTSSPAPAPKPKKLLPPANTLKFIGKAVKKTTPEEAQRQFEAREEARKKAMLSNLTFGSNPASWDMPSNPGGPAPLPPIDGQLERNRAFAEALGVPAPAPTLAKLQGWARPFATVPNTVYPDGLILEARENMAALLKLERKWKTFLEDDKAASLPLNKMDSRLRKFVHEYSDFWKLHTESFDPEPKRYIHCVKLLDTSAPCPLLSDAARSWRGPTGNTASSEHALQQTAGQDTRGREAPRAALLADLPSGPAASLELNPRAAALSKERPRLELKGRTLPLELPPFQPPTKDDEVEVDTEELLRRRQAKQEEQRRKQQVREERKQQVLQAAFASDSEEESLGEAGGDSDWDEPEELYPGSDDEQGAEEAVVTM